MFSKVIVKSEKSRTCRQLTSLVKSYLLAISVSSFVPRLRFLTVSYTDKESASWLSLVVFPAWWKVADKYKKKTANSALLAYYFPCRKLNQEDGPSTVCNPTATLDFVGFFPVCSILWPRDLGEFRGSDVQLNPVQRPVLLCVAGAYPTTSLASFLALLQVPSVPQHLKFLPEDVAGPPHGCHFRDSSRWRTPGCPLPYPYFQIHPLSLSFSKLLALALLHRSARFACPRLHELSAVPNLVFSFCFPINAWFRKDFNFLKLRLPPGSFLPRFLSDPTPFCHAVFDYLLPLVPIFACGTMHF